MIVTHRLPRWWRCSSLTAAVDETALVSASTSDAISAIRSGTQHVGAEIGDLATGLGVIDSELTDLTGSATAFIAQMKLDGSGSENRGDRR
jgi:hypothetical protein